MMAQQGRSRINPLLRRLRRHANMATIFRSTAELGRITAVTPGSNLVRAFVWSAAAKSDTVEAAIALAERPAAGPSPTFTANQPAGQPSVQRQPFSPARLDPGQQPVTTKLPPIDTDVAGPETAVTPPPSDQTVTKTQPATPPMQRQPEPEPAAPPATSSETRPGPLSRLWQRIGEVIRPSTPAPAAAETTPQPPPTPPTAAVATKPALASEAATPAVIQRQPETPLTATPAVAAATEAESTPPAPAPIPSPAVSEPVTAVDPPAIMAEKAEKTKEAPANSKDRNWQRLETIMQRHTERLAAEQTGEPDKIDDTPGSTSPPPPVQRRPRPQPPARPAATPPIPAAPAGQTAPSKQKLSDSTPAVFTARSGRPQPKQPVDTPPPVPVESDDPKMETAVEPAPVTPTAPLHEVWPVQRLEAEPPNKPPLSGPVPSPPPNPTPSPPPAVDSRIQERLANVPPGMPTDSSVPLLRPRQPRPQPTPAMPVQDDEPASAPVVQLQAATEQVVPTEIGELPADLWELIGQQPPQMATPPVAPPPVAPPSVVPPVSLPPATVDRHEPAAEFVPGAPTSQTRKTPRTEPVGKETGDISSPAVPTLIQREPALNGTEGTAVSQPASEEENEEDEPEAELDVDELARQVYAQLKQRLASDMERERGRLAPNW